MGKTILIPMTMVMASLEGVAKAGVDIAPLLKNSGIPPALAKDLESHISVDQFARLNRNTRMLMNDEMYGLLARPIRVGTLQASSLNMVHARDIGEALDRFVSFNRLFDNSLTYELLSTGDQIELVIHRREGWKVLNSFAIVSSLAFPHRFLGWLANERILLNQVLLDYAPPVYADEYRQIFYGAPCLFNQQKTSIQFDRMYLNHPIVQTEASLEQYMGRLPLDNYLPLDAGGKTTVEVRNWVNKLLRDTEELPDFDEVAEKMECHPQALRRRLKVEGTHYSAIRTQIRRDLAMHLLGVGELSIAEIAYKAGYTEPSAFIRAFKSWTGLTPLHFRQGYRSE